MRNGSLRLAALAVGMIGITRIAVAQSGTVSAPLLEVIAKPLQGTTVLPGELRPYRAVDVYAKVSGFVESVHVDRGSRVKKGDLLATITAPEMDAQIAEARAQVVAIESQRAEAEAKRAAAESTFQRLREAAKTPGVVAGNDLILAEKAVEAERARITSIEKSVQAANASVTTVEEMRSYLRVAAEFEGVITDRFAHEGSLVGPQSKHSEPMFRHEQIASLRLVVPVPEDLTAAIRSGARVHFTVSAHPGQ
jgi:membrane fusion protein (multidrug efflux system)